MPLWGIFAIGIGAALGGWLLGTRKIQQEVGQIGLLEVAKEWDGYTLEEQDRFAKDFAQNLRESGDARAMLEGAKFLDGMDRPTEAEILRAESARVTASRSV